MIPEALDQSTMTSDKRQQDKLNSKLQERLGYSGVYFNRDSSQFFNHLSIWEQQQLLTQLKRIYSQILLNYFVSEANVNELIDRFVEKAFFVNLPMNKVVEIHMELIDGMERQYRLEGLHLDSLTDFRLTLIDVIAHLGEMYRSVICQRS